MSEPISSRQWYEAIMAAKTFELLLDVGYDYITIQVRRETMLDVWRKATGGRIFDDPIYDVMIIGDTIVV